MTQTIEKITLELVRDTWRACYSPERLALLFDRPLTAVEVLTRQDGDWHEVPIEDRLWVVLHEGVLSDRVLRLFAAACAEKACQDAGWTDPRSLAAIQAARDFANGKITAEELAARRYAAYAARRYAAYAAYAAAWAAHTRPATAAERAASSAVVASRAVVAWADALKWQLQTLLKLIEEGSQ